MFLREQSLPLPLAQRVAERHGPQTAARVQQDPYVALAGFGLPFRWAMWGLGGTGVQQQYPRRLLWGRRWAGAHTCAHALC